MNITQQIATDIQAQAQQVDAAIRLLDEGATVPFIARYRKEATQGLDDGQLRLLETRLHYLRELNERRDAILSTLSEQGNLTQELRQALDQADTKVRLEELYLPYKPKRRNKAQIAREAGLSGLAERLLTLAVGEDEVSMAAAYLNPEHGIQSASDALEGARHILMEQLAEDADFFATLRENLWPQTRLLAKAEGEQPDEHSKFKDYFDYEEAIANIPSHRALALLRGRRESVLQLTLAFTPENEDEVSLTQALASHFKLSAHPWLQQLCRRTWKIKVQPRLELEFMRLLRERADAKAIQVFAQNLKALLLAAPAGGKATLGLDPGLRTGVKVAVVDATGKLCAHTTIYPHPPKNQQAASLATLAALCQAHDVALISIGNGTASRETDHLVKTLQQQHPELGVQRVVVSEAGASVYSASELAAAEFPDLDVSIRGAVSIARRLQDPLAELVKIEPKAIGVGQYQHDVDQLQLEKALQAVVEDCVNAVGVDVNTASATLLAYVSGLNQRLAHAVVAYRQTHGAFADRMQLKQVPYFGEKTFEQAAGFLRINQGQNPLDQSGVHPESYPLVAQILSTCQLELKALLGNKAAIKQLNAQHYVSDQFGLPTIKDILEELEKPGRDPRPEFHSVQFDAQVHRISDLTVGKILPGVVTNVANFGAFVDIGVHQDGLVHISQLADRFVRDPHEVVKTGDVVQVKVLEVDEKRKRISLTLCLQAPASAEPAASRRRPDPKPAKAKQKPPAMENALQAALKKTFQS